MDYNSLIDKLANLTNITRCTLARIETKKSIPKIDTFLKIVNALDCKILLDSV